MVEWNVPGTEGQTSQFNWRDYYLVILCRYCDGSHHVEACPRVEEIEYHPNGTIKRIKLRKPEPTVMTVSQYGTTVE